MRQCKMSTPDSVTCLRASYHWRCWVNAVVFTSITPPLWTASVIRHCMSSLFSLFAMCRTRPCPFLSTLCYLYLYLRGGRPSRPSSAEAIVSFGPMRSPELHQSVASPMYHGSQWTFWACLMMSSWFSVLSYCRVHFCICVLLFLRLHNWISSENIRFSLMSIYNSPRTFYQV